MKNPSTISSGESDALTLPFAILDDELAALHRFYETAEDGQDYDVPVSMMKRMAVIGLVRRVTGSRYEFTDFGLSVRNGDFSAALATQPAESKTCASVGVEPSAELVQVLAGIGYEAGQSSLIDRGPAWQKVPITDALVWMNAAEAIYAALASPAPSVGEPDDNYDPEIPVARSLLIAAVHELARYALPAGADDQVIANLSACCGIATPPAAPAATEAPSDINWKVVGVLIEAHMAASRYHTTGTSNWGAALYKALRREFPAPAPAVGASVQPAAGALPPVRWWSGVVGSPEKLANLLDGYSEKKESPRRDERVMRAAAKWIREVVASVQPVLASLSDERIIEEAKRTSLDKGFVSAFRQGAAFALASSTPTTKGHS